jgi:coproporphyrinogen III oxidase-like Fe-S oxidoreductase
MAIPWEDWLWGWRPAKRLWKPLLKRYLTGTWKPFRMEPGEGAYPSNLEQLGLYLHVPFCRQPCAYCPYNRVKFDVSLYKEYDRAAHQEIDLAAARLAEGRADNGPLRIGSLYVGGGTPTIEPESLARLVSHIRESFGRPENIGVELHPAAMDDGCLKILKQIGVNMVSVGVESLTDRLLALIGRSHDAAMAEDALRRAVAEDFDTVSADIMFALPTQTLEELDRDLDRVLKLGVGQISTYPIFTFPYTELGRRLKINRIQRPRGGLIRDMLAVIRSRACEHELERCSVWSFGRGGRKKFTSTTRHHYLGIGPSAASMLPGRFFVNTFSIEQYASTLPHHLPVALAMPVDRKLEMAYWLYWRIYEMSIPIQEFSQLFGRDLESVHGRLLSLLTKLGILNRENGCYHVTEKSAYWIHRLQNEYALNYINNLWGTCRNVAWPSEVTL